MSDGQPRYGTPVRLALDGGAVLDVGAEHYAPDRVLVRLAVDSGDSYTPVVLTESEARQLAGALLRVLRDG